MLSGLRIGRCHELWCRSQTQLGAGVAVAATQASGYSSDSTPNLGTSIYYGVALKRERKKGRKEGRKEGRKKERKKGRKEFLSWLSGNKPSEHP